MFIPLKVTTDYSLLKSMITIPKLALFLEKYNIFACGICDTNLFGVMEFYNTLKAKNIKPLIGLEIKIENITLYLYAKNYQGYQVLLKLNTKKEKEEITLEELIEKKENLNIILPYFEIENYKKLAEKLEKIYIGYTKEIEKNNANILTENLVFCPNIKAFTKKETEYLPLLEAIDLNESIKLIEKKDLSKNSMEYAVKEEKFLDKTEEFVASCNVEILKKENYIPTYLKEGSSEEFLVALAKKGLQKRLKNERKEKYIKRLNYELSVIQNMGFVNYFLIVYDYVKYAKQNKILVGVGRGSAVGSLVSYCLGITDVDPLEYNLLFERFLNPERITMPDIDIDFEETRRDEVINYVKEKYGKENVANIMTFGTLKSKLALRSVGKSLEINQAIIDAFVNKIDIKKTLQENLQNKEILYYVEQNEDIKKMMLNSLKIEGLKKHISTHAAGVVISSVPLDTVIPIHFNNGDLLTGVTMNYLEDLGLLKMDFLSISNLTIIRSVLELIEENTNQKLDINKIDLNDQSVLDLFTNANTIGIFQFESEGMKSFLRKLKPTKFLDLVAAMALYRPGPMDNIDTYIKRKEGKEKIEYLHPDLKDILEETYGIIVYQEQIMQILVLIGGFSFSEADIIRRAMSKKKKEIIEEYKEKFIIGARKKGYIENVVLKIYELIVKFADYGFNKSHSVSYALFGYQMAYLKTYYPIYYIANLLNLNIASTIKTKEYLGLAKKMGIKVLPPSVNKSELTYKIEGNTIRLPFEVIKGLGSEAGKVIVNNRPYLDFFDFVKKTYGKSVTKKTIESLISAGAFLEIEENQNSLRKSIEKALKYAELSIGLEEDFILKPVLEESEKEREEEKRKKEYEVLGFYLSNHPSSRYIEEKIMKLEHIEEYHNKHVECVVVVEKIKELTTKKGERMAFLTASDETDVGNFVVFASIMKYLQNVKIGDLILIEGRIARRYLEYQINVNKIEKISGGE